MANHIWTEAGDGSNDAKCVEFISHNILEVYIPVGYWKADGTIGRDGFGDNNTIQASVDSIQSHQLKAYAWITSQTSYGDNLDITTSQKRTTSVNSLLDILNQFGFDGAADDPEEFDQTGWSDFVAYVNLATTVLNGEGFKYNVAVFPMWTGSGYMGTTLWASMQVDKIMPMMYGGVPNTESQYKQFINDVLVYSTSPVAFITRAQYSAYFPFRPQDGPLTFGDVLVWYDEQLAVTDTTYLDGFGIFQENQMTSPQWTSWDNWETKDIYAGGETQVATPSFNPSGGSYSSSQSVTISCNTSGATIHYTIDGSTPTSGSPTYSTPVTVSYSLTLKAIGIKDGLTDSSIRSESYTITGGGGTTTDTIGDATSFADEQNTYLQACPVTASASGTLQTIGLNIKSAAGNIRLGIYSSISGGVLHGLLGQSASTVATTGWNDLVISGSVNIVQGTTYYLGLQCDNATLQIYLKNANLEYWLWHDYGTFPDPTGDYQTDSNTLFNMRMTYSAGSVAYQKTFTDLFGFKESRLRKSVRFRNFNHYIGLHNGIEPVQGPVRSVVESVLNMNISLTSTPVIGNTLILCFGAFGKNNTFTAISSISQTGVTWTQQIQEERTNFSWLNSEIWLGVVNNANASKDISITLNNSPNTAIGNVREYYGLLTTGFLDKTAVMYNDTSVSEFLTGTTATKSQADELVIGCITTAYDQYAPTNGFKLFDGVRTNNWISVSYLEKITDYIGADSCKTITSPLTPWVYVGCIATFKAASAGAIFSRKDIRKRVLLDKLGGLDIVSKMTVITSHFLRYFTDFIGTKESRTRKTNFNRNFSDKIGNLDVFSKFKSKKLNILDKLGGKDTISKVKTKFKTFNDKLGAKDTVVKAKSKFKTFSELFGTFDGDMERIVNSISHFIRNIDELLGFKESRLRSRQSVRAFIDKLGALESRSRKTTLFRILTDKIGALDSKLNYRIIIKNINELLGLKDAYSRDATRFRIFIDKIGKIDLPLEIFKLKFKEFIDLFKVNDSFDNSLILVKRKFKIFSENLGNAELNITYIINSKIRIIIESIGASDGITKFRGIVRSFNDSLGASSIRSRLITLYRTITENTGMNESILILRNLRIRTIVESLGFKESRTRVKSLHRTITELSDYLDDFITQPTLIQGRMNAVKTSLINKVTTYGATTNYNLTIIDAWRMHTWDFNAWLGNLVSIKIMPSKMQRLSFGSQITNSATGQYYTYHFTLHVIARYAELDVFPSAQPLHAVTAMNIANGIINYLRENQSDTHYGVLAIGNITTRESDPAGLTRGGAHMARVIIEGEILSERPYFHKRVKVKKS